MISKELHDHLAAWLAWAENGAPSHPRFKTYSGLCSTFVDVELKLEFYALLDRDFPGRHPIDGYWFSVWPFERPVVYNNSNTLHLNPNRRAWVRKILQEPCQPAGSAPHTALK